MNTDVPSTDSTERCPFQAHQVQFQSWEMKQLLKCGQVRLICSYILGKNEAPTTLLFKDLKVSKSAIISQRKQLCMKVFSQLAWSRPQNSHHLP